MKISALPGWIAALACTLVLAAPCSAQYAALVEAPQPADTAASLAASFPESFSASAIAPLPISPVSVTPAPARIEQPRLHLLDWGGLAAAAALRVLDFTSTEAALAHPQYLHEALLPTALVRNKPAFAAFQAGTVGVNYLAYRVLVHHRMRSIARMSQYLYIGIMSGQVASNYQKLGQVPAATPAP